MSHTCATKTPLLPKSHFSVVSESLGNALHPTPPRRRSPSRVAGCGVCLHHVHRCFLCCGPKYRNGDLRQARGSGCTSVFSIKQHSLCDDGDIETESLSEYLFNEHAFKHPGKFR